MDMSQWYQPFTAKDSWTNSAAGRLTTAVLAAPGDPHNVGRQTVSIR